MENGNDNDKKEEVSQEPETGEAAPAPEDGKAEDGSKAAEDGEATDAAQPETPAGPDWKDRYARAMADFDNFRKRTARDREDLVKFAAAEVLKDMLTTADDLARALDGAKDNADDPFVSGVRLVYEGLMKTLSDHGATPLDSVGEPFDANYHEALAQIPSEEVEEGHVVNEVKRGWMLNGKLLRAAQVVVSSGKPS